MLSLLACAAALTPGGSYALGHSTVTWNDAARGGRSVLAEIWYPADLAGDDVPVAAAPAEGFPVVAFGHGFLMPADRYEYLWEALVPEGYVVVLPRTEGTVAPNHDALARDLVFLIQRLELEGSAPGSPFEGSIGDRSAVGGHSMGGGASVLAASYDPAIEALFNFAAAETSPPAAAAAASVAQPTLMIAGEEDCVTPIPQHQGPIHAALGVDCAQLVELDGASHCQFAEPDFLCGLGEFCLAGIGRTEQHQRTLALLVPWLDATLRGDGAAWLEFVAARESAATSTLFGSCAPGPLTSCRATANSTGSRATCRIDGTASVAANNLVLIGEELPPGTAGLFFYGPQPVIAPLGNGLLCIGGDLQRLDVEFADGGGTMRHSLDLGVPRPPSTTITAGSSWAFQAWFRDVGAGGAGSNTSDGLVVSFVP